MVKKPPSKPAEMRLIDTDGSRLYLNAEERAAFLAAARKRPPEIRTLCETLHFTGCRPSEALEITPARIDLDSGTVTLRTLKKHKRADGRPAPVVHRAVPVPPDYLDTLNTAHRLREAQRSPRKKNAALWPMTRQRVWQIVKEVMAEAGIPEGKNCTTKGLRHGFGVNAINRGVPLNMLKKWMGHASIEVTAIYADAVGKEEADLAAKMWD